MIVDALYATFRLEARAGRIRACAVCWDCRRPSGAPAQDSRCAHHDPARVDCYRRSEAEACHCGRANGG